jgi:putative ABC transport system substrate-binding protein
MRRRDLARFFGGAALATMPLLARAQQSAKIVRLGYLGFGTAAASAVRVDALREGLGDLGYVEGKNLVIEFRWADTVEKLREGAAELAAMKVDVIFGTSSTETDAARRVNTTIPFVFGTHADPVGVGHIASLSHPGGNITGLSVAQSDFTAKSVEILKETVPHAVRIAVLWTPTAPSGRPTLQAAESTGEKLGLQVASVPVHGVEDFAEAFATMTRDRADAVLVHAAALTARVNRPLLAELALKHRLPSMFQVRENVQEGGLMCYTPDHSDLTRRAAVYIDKILRGARPADLPVEQASRYRLIINLKTAEALGLMIPSAILARADEVIE